MGAPLAKLLDLELPKSEPIEVHFNPTTLRLVHSASGPKGTGGIAGRQEQQSAPAQNTGYSVDLSLELLFDTSTTGEDVRGITQKVADLTKPAPGTKPSTTARRVRFDWEHFSFVGHVQSVTETIDLFTDTGVPVRATVTFSMNEIGELAEKGRGSAPGGGLAAGVGLGAGAGLGLSAGVGFSVGASAGAGVSLGASASFGFNANLGVGTTPLTLSQSGESLQGLTGRAGAGLDWKAVASANGIDNPRLMQPGTVLNLDVAIR